MKVTPARPELTVKFNQLPVEFVEEQGGARTFELGGESGPSFVVTLSKKSCKRLGKAAEEWPEWTAVVGGRFGELLGPNRYRVESAGLINVIERKPKESVPAAPAATGAESESHAAHVPAEVSPPHAASVASDIAVRVTAAVLEALAPSLPVVLEAPARSSAASAAPLVHTVQAASKKKKPHPFVANLSTPPPAPRSASASGKGRFRSMPIVTYRGSP